MEYKLIASDLDETLLNDDHVVPESNIYWIQKAVKERGVKFVPATGRGYMQILPELTQLGLKDMEGEYVLSFNGAALTENKDNRIIEFNGLGFDKMKEIFEFGLKQDVCIHVYTNDTLYIYNLSESEAERIKHQKLEVVYPKENSVDFLKDACGIPERICCRYNPGGYFSLGTDIMDNPGDAKYGMTKPQIFEAFKRLKREGVKEFGIHSFLASNTVSNEYYPALASILFNLAVELKENLGVHIGFINLSGGVGIPYTPDKEPNDIFAIGEGVRKAYEEILVPAGMGDVKIFTELGRFMLAPHGHLVVKAIHEKHTYKEYIGVDACAANLMRPAMYGAYHHITVMGKENEPCDHTYDVVGSLCENNDKFAIDRKLPKIDMGDLLVLHDTGAHGFAMGYNYNGRLKSAEILLQEDGSTRMIRRAETPEDYFATIEGFDF